MLAQSFLELTLSSVVLTLSSVVLILSSLVLILSSLVLTMPMLMLTLSVLMLTLSSLLLILSILILTSPPAPLQNIPVREARQAEMALLSGNAGAAEHQLLQAGLHFRAVMLHVALHNWERALEVALRQGAHVPTVLAYRKRHLNRFNVPETLSLFLQHQDKV